MTVTQLIGWAPANDMVANLLHKELQQPLTLGWLPAVVAPIDVDHANSSIAK